MQKQMKNFIHRYRWPLCIAAVVGSFALYIAGLSNNPPGFYMDESGIAYNAYLIAHTGAGESGARWPLFFQFYTGGFTQYGNPTQIYLLALLFRFLPPSILAARIYSAAWIFLASLLLGYLAMRISRRRTIGIIVGLTALLTPWLFEVSRLVLDIFFYPMALVLFLLALHGARNKEKWTLGDNVKLGITLALLTYTYTIGRLLAPILAVGLLIFATNRQRLFGVLKTWGVYLLTLPPLIVFRILHPDLTQRFYLISYIKPGSTFRDLSFEFIRRYLEDLSLINLLLKGDINPRHHVQGSLGSILVATFILAVIGLFVVIVRHWRDPWWRFILFGLAVSVIPGALTVDQFHTLRLISYPVFLLVLTVPALVWLLEDDRQREHGVGSKKNFGNQPRAGSEVLGAAPAYATRRLILFVLLALTTAQAAYFQSVFRRDGPERGDVFDSPYKEVFDAASAQTARPIYLVDGYWGPAYIHAYWYATLERRNVSEFIHLPYGVRPPAGSIVISSEQNCVNCQIITRKGVFLLYRTL